MTVQEILLLGNPQLYEVSQPVEKKEIDKIRGVVSDLHDTLMDFRKRHGVGRAIAAPQIGVMKRLIYMHIDSPTVIINPQLSDLSEEMITVWDDCMSFPDLLVKVPRHKSIRIEYYDLEWKKHSQSFVDSLSELLQHEYDHLDGVLAVSRAIDKHSFVLKSQEHYLGF